MDFHRFLSRAHGVLCGSPRVTMSPWLSNNEDIRTRFYHSMHSHSSARSIAAPRLAKCARNGAPRVTVGARKSEVGDPPEFSCRIHFLRRLRTRVAENSREASKLLAVAMAERTLGMLSDHIAYQVLNGDVLALAATFREHLSYRKRLRRLCKPPVRRCLHQTSYIRQCQREKRPTK
jgi:hypothetical protein